MNIQSSPALSLPLTRPIQRPVPQTLAKEPQAGSGTLPPTATGGPAQQQIDIATVLRHWGTSNAEADLNVDGIVDAQDLAIASAEQNSGSTAVQNSWGQSGVQDANGDGVVDATDLAHALNAQTTPASNDETTRGEVIGAIVDVALQARDEDGDGAIVSSDFKDNGRIFRQLDLDQNGSVGREELEKALNAHFDRFTERHPNANPNSFAARWIETFLGKRPAPDLHGMDRISQLFQQGAGNLNGRGGLSNILSARA